MPIYHENLVGAQVHEPKGAASAAVGTYYFSDGASGGTWEKLIGRSTDTLGDATVEFTGLSAYSRILLEIHDISFSLTGDERLDLVVGDSGGYKTSAGYYYYTNKTTTTEVAPRADTKMEVFDTDLSSGTYYYNGHIFIENFNKNKFSTIECRGVYSSDATIQTNIYPSWSFGATTTAEDYDRLKLYTRNGATITGSDVEVFGWKG